MSKQPRDNIEVGDLVEVIEEPGSLYYVGPEPWTARVAELYKTDATELAVVAEPPIPGNRHERMPLSSHDKVTVIRKWNQIGAQPNLNKA